MPAPFKPNQLVKINPEKVHENHLGEEWLDIIGIVKKVRYYPGKQAVIHVQHPDGYSDVFFEEELIAA
jgi:hypothetical protein